LGSTGGLAKKMRRKWAGEKGRKDPQVVITETWGILFVRKTPSGKKRQGGNVRGKSSLWSFRIAGGKDKIEN